MKKIALSIAGCAIAMAFSSGVQAFDIGGAVKSAAKDAGKMVVVSETNKKIKDLAAKCKCDVKTGRVTNCDYSAMKGKVSPARTGLKTALNRDANIHVTTASHECSSEIQTNMTGWWSWNTARDSSMGSTVKIELQ